MVKSKSFTLRTQSGDWLGQVVITSDGMCASVTDWGNLSYAWRNTGDDFRKFICDLNVDYFGLKMYTGMTYLAYGSKFEAACKRYAQKILPVLQAALREDLLQDPDWT